MEKHLTLNQQLALMPVAIPDSILDFLSDFNFSNPLENEISLSSFDSDYFREAGESLRSELLRYRGKKIIKVHVEPCGREIPGAFMTKIIFENGESSGIGFLTKLKERTIFKIFLPDGEYNEEGLKESLRNLPR